MNDSDIVSKTKIIWILALIGGSIFLATSFLFDYFEVWSVSGRNLKLLMSISLALSVVMGVVVGLLAIKDDLLKTGKFKFNFSILFALYMALVAIFSKCLELIL